VVSFGRFGRSGLLGFVALNLAVARSIQHAEPADERDDDHYNGNQCGVRSKINQHSSTCDRIVNGKPAEDRPASRIE